MAKFIVTLEVEFDPTGAEQLKAPRQWAFFRGSRERWNKFVTSVRVISITDPVLTPEEEKWMSKNWRLANHDLEP